MIEGEIVNRLEVRVLGPQTRIDPQHADYTDLWENGFMPRYEEIRSLATDAAYYAVYFPCGVPGRADFVAGMAAEERTPASQGLVLRTVPGGLYAAFRCRMKLISPTWSAVYREWLPSSGYVEDESRPAVEYYPPETTGPDSEVTIFVPVKAKPPAGPGRPYAQ